MKIHEYQGKKILKSYGIPIQDGFVTDNNEDIESTIDRVSEEYSCSQFIVKAQIHAGGRGKGGGVKFCPDKSSAIESANNILGMNLVTPQTGEAGQKVRKIYITKAFDISHEYYIAITLDRSKNQDVIMASTEGGMDIEKVAEETPEKIIKVWVDPIEGLHDDQIKTLVDGLGFRDDLFSQVSNLFKKLYKCYIQKDTTMLEINPLVKTEDNNVVALDSKFNFDGNAMFRHPDVNDMEDPFEVDETELEAGKFNLNYIKLDGNVGCMVNGAGLAMATMDIIKLSGGEPANFLDVGGAASVDTVKNGFKIILKDSNVKAILINIFGGIVRCDRVAKGVVQAVQELNLDVPVVVRLEGTNAIEAKEILENSEVKIIPATTMQDAADKVVDAALN
ncbi:MAG: succinate--CoA ligase subunit beta [bacterium TMED161]|nr:ADP-forming succinate--CoA ligase subunit beta [Candidatus Neomarinimicrobiota bacterium]OUW20997.1 MAG: succinate--CoA ligase subunit beta [bacterium TMED161]